ncbi:MAG: FtsX-like permease family protein, partial [Oscillospiraceae bacterium]|nr:FtsX-like permease family protein [Oscillospiraceae bacterium]
TSSLKITGIFEYVGNVSQTPWLPYTEIENFIFIPYNAFRSIFNVTMGQSKLFLYLKDSSLIEEYIQETNKKLDEKYTARQRVLMNYNFAYDNEWFDTVSKPVQSVNIMTIWMVIIIAIGTYITILLISTLILMGKKREIGIYLSIGESKIILVFQIIMEQMAIILISLIIACGISFLISQAIGKSFIETSASDVNKQIEEHRDIIRGNDGYYFIINEIQRSTPTFLYVKDEIDISNNTDKIIEYIFISTIILVVSLTCQIVIFMNKNSVVNLLQKT